MVDIPAEIAIPIIVALVGALIAIFWSVFRGVAEDVKNLKQTVASHEGIFKGITIAESKSEVIKKIKKQRAGV